MKFINTKTFFTVIFLLWVAGLFAQVPQQINYQAVARNGSGAVLANQSVSLRFTVRDNTNTGTIVYQEVQSGLSTNQFGIFTAAIGAGAPVGTYTFSGIVWGTNAKFLQVELDPSGGTNYIDMGTSQLNAVPYALYAANAPTGPTGATGPTGLSGSGGGATGPTGAPGATGAEGQTGVAGPRGTTGAAGSANAWGLSGNTGTVFGTNYIGTNDGQDLMIKVDGQEAGFIKNPTLSTGSTAFGMGALASESASNTTPNTAIGSFALNKNTIGGGNVAIGPSALLANISGNDNIALGNRALLSDTGGSGNIALGTYALTYNLNGQNNTAVGVHALQDNVNSSYNTAIGYYAGVTSDTLTNATAIGAGAQVSASNSLVLGSINGQFLGISSTNVGIGTSSPAQTLTVVDPGNTNQYSGTLAVFANNLTEGVGIGYMGIAAIGSTTDQNLALNAKGTGDILMQITGTTGNVGIGTASPGQLLTVVDPGNSNAYSGTVSVYSNNLNEGVGIGYTGVSAIGSNTNQNLDFNARGTGNILMQTSGTTGRVGIGVSSPNAPLHVGGSGSITTASLARVYFDNNSTTTLTDNTGASGNVMVQADGWFWANGGGFVATSDARIKNIKGETDNSADLQTIAQIRITDYHYIDHVAHGDMPQKKVIAQQVKEVYPQAISVMEGIIPDIYDTARTVSITGTNTIIKTTKPHNYKTGDHVKLIAEKTGEKVLPVTVIDTNTFSVTERIDGKIFVYGKQVTDLLTVDYDAISMLNVSATQELYKLLLQEKEKNKLLDQKLSEQNLATQSDIGKLKASIENLQQIVGSKAQK